MCQLPDAGTLVPSWWHHSWHSKWANLRVLQLLRRGLAAPIGWTDQRLLRLLRLLRRGLAAPTGWPVLRLLRRLRRGLAVLNGERDVNGSIDGEEGCGDPRESSWSQCARRRRPTPSPARVAAARARKIIGHDEHCGWLQDNTSFTQSRGNSRANGCGPPAVTQYDTHTIRAHVTWM